MITFLQTSCVAIILSILTIALIEFVIFSTVGILISSAFMTLFIVFYLLYLIASYLFLGTVIAVKLMAEIEERLKAVKS